MDRESNDREAFPKLDDAVRAHIESALSLVSGRIEGRRGAAALLGLNPHTLRGKMRKLGIDPSVFRCPVRGASPRSRKAVVRLRPAAEHRVDERDLRRIA